MKTRDLDIVIVGVGGQGTLLTSKILAQLALIRNLGVKVSEVHGMSQRGGSVITHVRIGDTVHSPLVSAGGADYLLAFEPLEAARAVSFLKENGRLILNSRRVSPMPVLSGAVEYPEDPHLKVIGPGHTVEALDAHTLAVEAGSHRSVNLVLLGILSKYLSFTPEDWAAAIAACVPPHTLESNQKAFESGRSYSA